MFTRKTMQLINLIKLVPAEMFKDKTNIARAK